MNSSKNPATSPKILAISGGIDSMVMLDIFVKLYPAEDLIVAHFNHNIRPDSNLDQFFVQQKASNYGLKFFSASANPGGLKSEASARSARYNFLEKLAITHRAQIFTAQHVDDLVESIIINLIRGTGWRGLAVMNRKNVFRPFLDQDFLQNIFFQTKNLQNNFFLKKISKKNFANYFSKNKKSQIIIDKKWIFTYAAAHNITWREDSTNSENIFLRNYIRELLIINPLSINQKTKLLNLSQNQKNIAAHIDQIFSSLKLDQNIKRAQFIDLSDSVAYEFLRFLCKSQLSGSDLVKLLAAIRTYAPNKTVNLTKNRLVKIHQNYFQLP